RPSSLAIPHPPPPPPTPPSLHDALPISLNIAPHVGCRATYNAKRCSVAIFSLEMPKEQLVMRMLASEARVDAQRMRTGRLIESRSEDHTSELQSRGHLVCRLLLEKKKHT